MIRFRQFSSLVLLLLVLLSCHTRHHDVTRGIYYWKTNFKPTTYEQNRIKEAGVKRIYLRFFDVDEDVHLHRPMPIAPLLISNPDTGYTYVPVVFITQRALIAMPDSLIIEVAGRIVGLTMHMCEQAHINVPKLQIDCDWTSSNKEKYFRLLSAIRQHPWMIDKKLSATIRMNQVKYQTLNGIPPVDKGLIMAYGMGDLKKPGYHNSILNADEAKEYLKFVQQYPIPVDMALPIYEWCVLFRDQQFKGILREVYAAELKSSRLFKLQKKTTYTCLQDTMWHGYYLKANDQIRSETSNLSDIMSTAKFTSALIKNNNINVVLFSCDSLTLSKYSNDDLEKIFSIYQ